ncbi:MAG: hypothetical protein AB7E55_07700 [Pigmentiphaga sp.]
MSDAPIEPQDYTWGVKVVDIGDIRVARGMTRRPASTCNHRHQVYDDKERRIWCSDCESELEPFDAYMRLVETMDSHIKNLQRREQQVKEAEQHVARSRAVKVMDEAWRSTTMAPLCPHCNAAILPEDVARGVAKASKKLIIARRNKQKPSA